VSATPRGTPRSELDLPHVLALARTADYFSLLGVPRCASGADIRDAATRLLSALELRRLTTPPGTGSSDLQEARQVVLDARDVLADDAMRAAYLNGIEDVARSPSPSQDVASSTLP
jgi:DnaJ-class molecular chaperone